VHRRASKEVRARGPFGEGTVTADGRYGRRCPWRREAAIAASLEALNGIHAQAFEGTCVGGRLQVQIRCVLLCTGC